MAVVADKWSNIIRKEEKNSVKWAIPNFNCRKERNNNAVHSSIFTFTGKLSYNITIKIAGASCKERYVQVTLPKISTVTAMRINLTIAGQNGKSDLKKKKCLLGGGGDVTFKMFEEKRGCLMPREHITILCEVILQYYENSTNIEGLIKLETHEHLRDLYTHKKHWDVMFVVAGHELNAHKCILASRSEVFAAMFEHEMEESKSNKVVIDDIDFEVFDEMLRYIYTNAVLNLKQNASGLLAASEKYNLKDLKCLCEAKLIETVTIKNAIETLMLADLYRAEELKNYTMDFISINRKNLANTEEFKKLGNSHNHLLLELYLKL